MAEAILNQPQFQDVDAARAYLENLRWPAGTVCPHCGVVGTAKQLHGAAHRPGLWKCQDCRSQFSVTVGTVFEDSKVALNKWLMAVHLMCASKKGISAKQLERMLGVSYKTAWFMAHRIREAMTGDNATLLGGPGSSGVVEADETYWGNATDATGKKPKPVGKKGYRPKMAVVTLVERDGDKRSFHVANVNGANLNAILRANVSKEANLMTDELRMYRAVGREFASHKAVMHGKKEYARKENGVTITSNTAESSFAILKRGLVGTFHAVSERHLQRYCNEFDFKWNNRQSQGVNDVARADAALKGIAGKRLMYRGIGQQQKAVA